MPKIKPLVTQHLENISREVLRDYSGVVTEYIRGRRGIYALYDGRKLYYVGLASNLRSRLRQHLNDRHADSWDRFSVYLTITDTHMKELESLLLRIVDPKGNKVSGKFKKSENLKRKLTRDIKRLQNEERADLVGGRKDRPKRGPKKVAPIKSKATGRKPVLAPYADKVTKIRGRYDNKWVRARVRKDGTIGLKGEVFNSPSKAAAKVCGKAKNGGNSDSTSGRRGTGCRSIHSGSKQRMRDRISERCLGSTA